MLVAIIAIFAGAALAALVWTICAVGREFDSFMDEFDDLTAPSDKGE
jgi:hypothetical protein